MNGNPASQCANKPNEYDWLRVRTYVRVAERESASGLENFMPYNISIQF